MRGNAQMAAPPSPGKDYDEQAPLWTWGSHVTEAKINHHLCSQSPSPIGIICYSSITWSALTGKPVFLIHIYSLELGSPGTSEWLAFPLLTLGCLSAASALLLRQYCLLDRLAYMSQGPFRCYSTSPALPITRSPLAQVSSISQAFPSQ